MALMDSPFRSESLHGSLPLHSSSFTRLPTGTTKSNDWSNLPSSFRPSHSDIQRSIIDAPISRDSRDPASSNISSWLDSAPSTPAPMEIDVGMDRTQTLKMGLDNGRETQDLNPPSTKSVKPINQDKSSLRPVSSNTTSSSAASIRAQETMDVINSYQKSPSVLGRIWSKSIRSASSSSTRSFQSSNMSSTTQTPSLAGRRNIAPLKLETLQVPETIQTVIDSPTIPDMPNSDTPSSRSGLTSVLTSIKSTSFGRERSVSAPSSAMLGGPRPIVQAPPSRLVDHITFPIRADEDEYMLTGSAEASSPKQETCEAVPNLSESGCKISDSSTTRIVRSASHIGNPSPRFCTEHSNIQTPPLSRSSTISSFTSEPFVLPRDMKAALFSKGFANIPTGVRPKHAVDAIPLPEIHILQDQALGQANRFEVLRAEEVSSLSTQVQTIETRCEYLRRSYHTLQSDRTRLHTKMVTTLTNPEAKVSREMMLKQAEALLDLDSSITEWFKKLERAENSRLRLRQKLLEHIAATVTISVQNSNKVVKSTFKIGPSITSGTPPLTPEMFGHALAASIAPRKVSFSEAGALKQSSSPVARAESPHLLKPTQKVPPIQPFGDMFLGLRDRYSPTHRLKQAREKRTGKSLVVELPTSLPATPAYEYDHCDETAPASARIEAELSGAEGGRLTKSTSSSFSSVATLVSDSAKDQYGQRAGASIHSSSDTSPPRPLHIKPKPNPDRPSSSHRDKSKRSPVEFPKLKSTLTASYSLMPPPVVNPPVMVTTAESDFGCSDSAGGVSLVRKSAHGSRYRWNQGAGGGGPFDGRKGSDSGQPFSSRSRSNSSRSEKSGSTMDSVLSRIDESLEIFKTEPVPLEVRTDLSGVTSGAAVPEVSPAISRARGRIAPPVPPRPPGGLFGTAL